MIGTNGTIEKYRRTKISYAALSILTPLPGTKLFDEKEHLLIAKDPKF